MIVWITGASSGLGRELALKYATQHYSIILSSRNIEKLESVKSDCISLGAKTVLVAYLDLSDYQSIVNAYQLVISKFSEIDLLINNGGIGQRSLANETSVDIDRQIMEIDFWGHVTLTKLVLPAMIERRAGQIVVISSLSGLFGFYKRSAYCAAKHALQGFFESLALEVAEYNVTITMVCPGRLQNNFSLNALTGKGSMYNIIDEAHKKGIILQRAANIIFKGTTKKKRLIVIGKSEQILYYIKRISPALFFRVAQWVKND